jgi:hypothetical protein
MCIVVMARAIRSLVMVVRVAMLMVPVSFGGMGESGMLIMIGDCFG